ncbi:hypothetical protein A2U01_0077773, partial [Trifolium medium]|nr:hypothetical protein [Trifolium medium]
PCGARRGLEIDWSLFTGGGARRRSLGTHP